MESYYNELIHQAKVAGIRQQYLDAIAEAGYDKERNEEDYFELAQDAYVDKELKLRDMPQQLAAEGLSGGRGDEELSEIDFEYDDSMEELKRERRRYLEDFEREVAKQNRNMQNALDKYNAEKALSDYKASKKSSKKKSSGSSVPSIADQTWERTGV